MNLFYKLASHIVELRSTVCYTVLKDRFTTVKMLTYEDAIYALNGLQSNSSVLEKARKENNNNIPIIKLHKTEKFLNALSITLTDIDNLNIIHISGTKGKGSTCAFTECILRHHGIKTGFYSSPHLVAVRERIRINGNPLSKEAFTSYFCDVYSKLKLYTMDNHLSMPPYFMFLTIMAFYVFHHEKVNAAVIEVGIGGLYDNTNIVRLPVVVGVTSLGYDHMSILGKTIEEIALQKAGIFKTGVPAFTVPQPENAMKILQNKASEINCSLHVVPSLNTYECEKEIKLGIPGEVQMMNSSLALQLCKSWINNQKLNTLKKRFFSALPVHFNAEHQQLPPPLALPFLVTTKFAEGLQNCRWHGRNQTIHRDSITYFLDGAHTAESMDFCIKWYKECVKKLEINKGNIYKILLFNCTGERKAETLLTPLINQQFDLVVFSPNKVDISKNAASDQSNFTMDPDKELKICEKNMKIWQFLLSSTYEEEISSVNVGSLSKSVLLPSLHHNNDHILVFSCLKDAIYFISYNHDSNFKNKTSIPNTFTFPKSLTAAKHLSILVTGSLHLVGNVLSLIDPELEC